ncbi:hypothetical protein N7513_002941 [Penicillium frequentans]|nr:hypothetical protein N7513_002941 [Penicillium glabrum]
MNRPCKRRRLSPKTDDQFMRQYKISFEGSEIPNTWPQYHLAMFTAIQDMKHVVYTKYVERPQSHSPQKSRIIRKADKLLAAAEYCRKFNINEQTWRLETEFPLLSQVVAEKMECEKCKLRLWLPEYHAVDMYSVEVHEKKLPLALCKCIENDQPGCKTSTHQRTFASGSDSTILPDPFVPEIGIKKPDYIIGFQSSPLLYAALQMHPDLDSSPVKDANHIKFPFLVLEAKSEVNGPGFGAVEKQTAFPIKRLVDIQKNLREMGKELAEKALVWFLAYIGDVWRVYACVPNGDGTRIIHLWHGCIQKRDDALQLCMIVDLICDWAWDILHRDIIRLLSSASETPTIPSNPSTKECDQGYAPSPSKRKTIIRNASEIFFSFRHLALPGSSRELAEILKSPSSGDDNVTANATKLLDLFNLKQPLLLPRSFISELERMWTCASDKYPVLHSGMLLFAHISFQSYFRPSDFHTVREISCITASHGAIRALEQMIGSTPSDFSCLLSISLRLEDVLPLATGSGQDSIRAAARNLRLTLHRMPKSVLSQDYFLEASSVVKCEWKHDFSQGEYISSFWSNIESRSPGNPLLLTLRRYSERRSSELRTLSIANEFSYQTIREFLGGRKRDFPCGAVILKTPAQLLQPLYPQYCLAVFGGHNLDDRSALGKKLSQLIEKGRLFEGKYRKKITDQDHQILQNWESRLRGDNGLST